MATQTGSIDLEATNAAKLYAEAGFTNAAQTYATKSELTVSANQIRGEVAETYATKTEVRRTDTGSGTVVSSDDAANLPPLFLTIHGASVQDGTPTPSAPVPIESVQGRNLMGNLVAGDYSAMGITCIVGEDNKITFGGTATSGGNIIIPLEETVPYPVGTVYWHYRNDAALGNMSMTLQPALAPYNGPSVSLSPVYKIAQGTNTQGITTIGSVRFYIQNGQTYSTVHFQPSIEYASNHTAWTPYGGISLASRGKNLLDTSITEATYASVTYTQGNSGEIVLNGTKYGGGYAIVKQNAFSLQAGTYTFSAELVSGTATATPTIYLLGNNDAVVFQVTPNAGSKKSHTVTLAEDTNIIKLRFGLFTDNSVYTNATYALQLELGSETTDYEPYTDASAYIPLRGNQPAVVPPTVSLGNGNFITTDSYEDFTKDFCLFIGFFRVAASRHCFASPNNSLPGVGIELTTGGLVRVYSVADTGVVTDKSLGTAVGIGSQCRFALMWSATAKTYTWLSVHDGLRESGTFAPSGSYTGTSTNPLRMGGDFRDSTGGKTTFPNAWTQWNIGPYFGGAFPENYASMMWYYNGDGYSWEEIGGYKLRSLPDGTEGVLEVDGEGNVTLTKRVGRAVIDGVNVKSVSATAATGSGEGVRHQISLLADADTSVAKRPVFYSESFYPSGDILTSSKFRVGMGLLYPYSSTVNFMAVLPSDCTTAALGNDWFAANPVEVLYPLATPQTISLGKIDLPSLPSPSFSMHVDASVTPTLDAEWWTTGGEEVGSVYQRTSALEQTSQGFTIRMDGIDGDVSDLSGDVSDLSGDLSDLSKDAVLKSKDTWTAWMDVGTDSNNDPYLTMGQSGNAFESRLTNRYMSFNEGTVELMRLSGEDGVKADTIRSKYVYIGSWILEQLDNGDMAIKLVGGE